MVVDVERVNMDYEDDSMKPVNKERLLEFDKALREYKAGKSRLERRVVSAEQWWKLRNSSEEMKQGLKISEGFKCKSGWLHNVLVTKHADAMESYPEPVFLPREPGDKDEAKKLSSIIPLVLEENDFEETYSQGWWRKLKTGTAIYKVTWDPDKLNGLGDISIRNIDILNVFWEPGITDIQKSKYVFHCELMDNDELEEAYPQLQDKLSGQSMTLTKYVYDDNVSTDNKSLVVDVYYKKNVNGKQILHYVKYVNDQVLFSTENGDNQQVPEADPYAQQNAMPAMGAAPGTVPAQMPEQTDAELPNNTQDPSAMGAQGTGLSQSYEDGAQSDFSMGADSFTAEPAMAPAADEKGLYEDGEYPFVFDTMFPIEGSPCGYGYVDLSQNAQMQLDLMDEAMLQNMVLGVTPRYFIRGDGGVNEKEFMDVTKPLVHVQGSIGDESTKVIDYKPISSNYVSVYTNKVQELRETSGNTETSNGISTGGVTSASGIAALQEASGKTSRDANKASYRAYRKIINMVVERVRQFYDLPRQFRITGQFGQEQFITYSNDALKPQPQGGIGNTDLGYRLPVFDITIKAQKTNAYSRTAQNDLAIQLFQLGIFNPQYSTPALNLIDMMEFEGKDDLMQKLQQNGSLYQKTQQLSQYVVALLNKYEPENAQAMAQSLGMNLSTDAGGGAVDHDKVDGVTNTGENPIVERARQRANEAAST